LLIGLGILFLLANLGVISFDFWRILIRFWPVLLIVAGLDLLFGRRANWLGGVIALLLLAFVVLAAYFTPVFRVGGSAGPVETQLIEQSARGVESANIRIDASISQLQIDAADADSDNLIEGSVRALPGENVISDYEVENDVARFVLESAGSSGPFIWPFFGSADRGQWDLRLNRDVPLRLTVSTGVGEAELTLEDLVLDDLDVNTGVGSTRVTLPDSGDFLADVEGGVGNLTIRVPQSLAVRIAVDAGLGGVSVRGDFVERDDVYVSPDYDDARERAEVRVRGGVGSITIRQVERR
jgi:hypothetical protein